MTPNSHLLMFNCSENCSWPKKTSFFDAQFATFGSQPFGKFFLANKKGILDAQLAAVGVQLFGKFFLANKKSEHSRRPIRNFWDSTVWKIVPGQYTRAAQLPELLGFCRAEECSSPIEKALLTPNMQLWGPRVPKMVPG